MNVIAVLDACHNFHVMWKQLGFLLVTKSQVLLLLLLYVVACIFTTEGNTQLPLELSDNEDVILFPSKSTVPLENHGAQVRNPYSAASWWQLGHLE